MKTQRVPGTPDTLIFAYAGTASLSKHEVELFLFEIGLSHTDRNRVAKLELAVAATADETVVLLVERIIIVAQLAHWYHTLALILVKLHINAPLGYA